MDKNLFFQLNKFVESKMCQNDYEIFKPVRPQLEFKECLGVYMPKSSFGLAGMILKNVSFDKVYTVEMHDKEIGKEKIVNNFLVFPQKQNLKNFEVSLEPGQMVSVSWICKENVEKEETPPEFRVDHLDTVVFDSQFCIDMN